MRRPDERHPDVKEWKPPFRFLFLVLEKIGDGPSHVWPILAFFVAR
jgi:hypothetical protein